MNILEVQSVSKQYASHKALSEVSLVVPQGVIFGLLGPNGAGKTSLIRIITQITKPDSGQVLFKGEVLNTQHTSKIGYLPEERGLYKKMQVGEQLLYMARLKGMPRTEALNELKQWVDRFEIGGWWNKKVDELSKGMQQKIQFIATVVHRPELLILDEPFSGFDPINAELITREILDLQKNGTTIIFSTHRMESVEQLCNDVALINQSKKVLDGNLNAIKKQFGNQSVVIEHNCEKLILSDSFTLLSTVPTPLGRFQSVIANVPESSYSQLLQQVLQQGTVFRFEEQIPSMQDIFVKVVLGS
jgi:ABC-2 type transport system ATP-binding protein